MAELVYPPADYPRLYLAHDALVVAFDEDGYYWCRASAYRDVTGQHRHRLNNLEPRQPGESTRRIPRYSVVELQRQADQETAWRAQLQRAQEAALRREAEKSEAKNREARRQDVYGPPLCFQARNRQIVLDRHGGMTLQQISDKWGISRERVRQIWFKNQRRLRFWRGRHGPLVAHLARIQGLPGDDKYRDVWRTYGVSPDPRMDNYYPI